MISLQSLKRNGGALRLYRSLLIAVALALEAGRAYGGAWTLASGDALFILTGSSYDAGERFDDKGHAKSQPDYRQYDLNPYIEYGLRDGVTIGADTQLQRASQGGNPTLRGQNNTGIGDSEIFLRKRLWQQNGFAVSIQPLIKLPSLQSSASDIPKLGNSHPDAALGLSGGYGFSAAGLNHFIALDTQYRYRFGAQKNQTNFAATAGIHVSQRWTIMPQAFLTYRTGKRANAGFTESSADDYNLVRLQLAAVYELRKDVSLQFGGFDDIYGKDTGHGRGVLLALWKRF